MTSLTRHDDLLTKVVSWKDLDGWDWLWIVLTAVTGLFTVVLSYSSGLQDWFAANGMKWLTTLSFATTFWMVWFFVGHDTLTTTLALIGTGFANIIVVGIGLIVLAFSTGFGTVIAKAIGYLFANAGKFGGWYFLGGVIAIIAALIFAFRHSKSRS